MRQGTTKIRRWFSVRWVWLVVLTLLLAACVPAGNWASLFATATPPPPTAAPTPTPTFTPTPTPSPTPTPTFTPTPKKVQAAKATPTPAPTPTPDQIVWVITEDTINEAIQSGMLDEMAGGQLQVKDLTIRFTKGRVYVTASQLRYSFISLNNLQAVINVWAEGGKVRIAFDQLKPSNLMTRMIPNMAAQALEQYTSDWYVKDIQIGEGKLTLIVRP